MKIVLPLLLSFACNFTFAQSAPDFGGYDSAIDHHLNKSKKLKRAAWITLGSGYLATGVALALAPTAKNQDNILLATPAIPVATFILHFKSTDHKNTAKLIEIERDLRLSGSHKDRQTIMDEAIQYFKQKANNNRTPAIILSAIGGIAVVSGLTGQAKMQDPFAHIAIAGGLAYVGASIPFYIRASKLEKTRRSLKGGLLPVTGFQRQSARLSMHLGMSSAGIRLAM